MEQKENDNEYHKIYYQKNKEKHKEYCRQKVVCEQCGATYQKSNTTNHRKTKKHIEALDKIENKYKLLKKKYKLLKKKYKKVIDI